MACLVASLLQSVGAGLLRPMKPQRVVSESSSIASRCALKSLGCALRRIKQSCESVLVEPLYCWHVEDGRLTIAGRDRGWPVFGGPAERGGYWVEAIETTKSEDRLPTQSRQSNRRSAGRRRTRPFLYRRRVRQGRGRAV